MTDLIYKRPAGGWCTVFNGTDEFIYGLSGNVYKGTACKQDTPRNS